MVTKTFVRLKKLSDLSVNEDQQVLFETIQQSDIKDEWFLNSSAEFEYENFTSAQVEYVDCIMYNFNFSPLHEEERVFETDAVVFKHKETNKHYVLDSENLY